MLNLIVALVGAIVLWNLLLWIGVGLFALFAIGVCAVQARVTRHEEWKERRAIARAVKHADMDGAR